MLRKGKKPPSKDTLDGEINSFWLKILNFMNTLSGNNLLPSNFSDLLPIIDIGGALELFLGSNIIVIPAISDVQCIEKRDVTVDAGTFESYEISIPLLGLNYFYAPDIGNIIKMSFEFGNNFLVNGELISVDY